MPRLNACGLWMCVRTRLREKLHGAGNCFLCIFVVMLFVVMFFRFGICVALFLLPSRIHQRTSRPLLPSLGDQVFMGQDVQSRFDRGFPACQ